eukprot:5665310-Amphidinium_carterae.1
MGRLQVEIANLGHLVEQGAGLSVNQENTVSSLMSQRDELLKTRDKLESQVRGVSWSKPQQTVRLGLEALETRRPL